MKKLTKMPTSVFYLILLGLMLIVLATSLQTLMQVKDLKVFEEWLLTQDSAQAAEYGENQMFRIFVTANMSAFVTFMIAPAIMAIHTYLSYTKMRTSHLFVFFWFVLMGANLALVILSSSFSVFLIINGIGYLIIFIALMKLSSIISANQRIV